MPAVNAFPAFAFMCARLVGVKLRVEFLRARKAAAAKRSSLTNPGEAPSRASLRQANLRPLRPMHDRSLVTDGTALPAGPG